MVCFFLKFFTIFYFFFLFLKILNISAPFLLMIFHLIFLSTNLGTGFSQTFTACREVRML